LTGVQGRQRHFRGWNEIERAALVGLDGLEELLLELRQLARLEHRVAVHQVRHPDLGVAVLPGVQIEHELGERALESRHAAPEDREARLGDPRGPLEIEPQRRADLLVGFRREGERARPPRSRAQHRPWSRAHAVPHRVARGSAGRQARRYWASTGAVLSDSTRATEPTRSSASRSMIRTPHVLRPCDDTSETWKRII